jgi:Tfp pilus assembly PilM family ATPase
MAQLLAIEWDTSEARVVVARSKGKEALLEDAFVVDLVPRDGQPAFSPQQIGARLAAELTARNIGRLETLVAIGRKDIELRLLNVPPAPPDELPDVVRFQALRQFSSLGEDWPLDYVPLEAAEETPTSVLAATLSAEHLRQLRATCEAANLAPKRMVLRPMAVASLLSRELPDQQGRCRLMVDLLTDEADLTVLVGERVVFLRTVRLPAHQNTDVQNSALLSELRRTMVAAQNQLGGRRVEYVIVCGNPTDHADLVERLQRELSLTVECFDPFAAFTLTEALRQRLPDRHGRFAPLLGMLLDEAAGTRHAIDFLNPRRKPPPPDKRRRQIIWGALAASLLGVVGLYFWSEFAAVGSQITTLGKQLEADEPLLKPAQRKALDAAEVKKFVHGDITWLEEMYRLSEPKYFPPGEAAIVSQFSANSREGSGGALLLEGNVSGSTVINQMETSLRDARHSVTGKGGVSDPKNPKYPWRFTETVLITHPEVAEAEAAAKLGPPQAPSAPRPAAKGGAR